MATTVQITFDAADPAALAQFWAEALGYELEPPPTGFDSWDGFLDSRGVLPEQRNSASAIHDPDGVGPRVFFQKVPEGKSVKNRVHLDLRKAVGVVEDERRMARLEAECERLVGLGATRVERFERSAMGLGHIVMTDPEGNEFCLD
jgi:hypothetical protein